MRVVVVVLFFFLFVCLFKRRRVNAPCCFLLGSHICQAPKEKNELKKSPEALMNARLDRGEVLMINIAHVFWSNRRK